MLMSLVTTRATVMAVESVYQVMVEAAVTKVCCDSIMLCTLPLIMFTKYYKYTANASANWLSFTIITCHQSI